MLLKGLDVSKWQGVIDWSKVRSRGLQVVYMKATEGTTYIDPTYIRNRIGAHEAGLLCGEYHYFTNNLPPEVQAKHFASTVRSAELPPVLDLESLLNVPNDIASRALIWLSLVEKFLMKTPIVYSGPNFLKNYLVRDPRYMELGKYPLWIANYDVVAPTIPRPWFPCMWGGWQFTSKVPGAWYGVQSPGLDLDVFDADCLGVPEVDIPN